MTALSKFCVFVCLSSCLLVLSACGAAKAPLQPYLSYHVRSIEVAKVEVHRSILIRRVNPLFLAMGSSGMLVDAVVVASNGHRYEQQAGSVLRKSVEVFEKTLTQSLVGQGLQVNTSEKRFWDYFKPSQKKLRETTDGILHVRLKQLGFWSKAVDDGYFPSVIVDVELIEPVSRQVLYSDRFAMGVDFTSVEVMAVAYGEIKTIPLDDRFSAYKNFKALLNSPKKSRDDLLEVMRMAAQHIAKGLQKHERTTILVFDPQLIKTMPEIPLSTYIEGRGLNGYAER